MFFEYLGNHFSILQNLEFYLRIVIAALCGLAIGYERTKRLKEAGIRTHMIVCCAAALFMIISKYSFVDLIDMFGRDFSGTKGADPARIAAQVVSGISFLGAGVIFKNNGSVKGLTTAAGLWATGGIGLTIGAGLYVMGIFTTILIALSQIVMHKFRIGADSFNNYEFTFKFTNKSVYNEKIKPLIEEWNGKVTDCKVARHEDGTADYTIYMRTQKLLDAEVLSDTFETESGILAYSVTLM